MYIFTKKSNAERGKIIDNMKESLPLCYEKIPNYLARGNEIRWPLKPPTLGGITGCVWNAIRPFKREASRFKHARCCWIHCTARLWWLRTLKLDRLDILFLRRSRPPQLGQTNQAGHMYSSSALDISRMVYSSSYSIFKN